MLYFNKYGLRSESDSSNSIYHVKVANWPITKIHMLLFTGVNEREQK